LYPDPQQLAVYKEERAVYTSSKETLNGLRDVPAVTVDGTRIELYGNIGTAADTDAVPMFGGEGIGLFRTEFLFI
jgi:phosphotransferase system enzyme I (PtsI)